MSVSSKSTDNPSISKSESNAPCELASRVFDSLKAAVAVIDNEGKIRATNEAWKRFALDNGGSEIATGIGTNYLSVCQSAQGDDGYLARQAYQGIKQVLDGTRDTYSLEYPCHSPTTQRWFLLTVSPLKGKPRHAVTTHLSITERKLVEMQLVESERLAAIGQAMQGLSHEGRNFLQRAQGCIDLLRCQIDADSEVTDLVEKVEHAQRRLIGLFEDVRRYAAPITLQRQPYRLNQLVQETWDSIRERPKHFRFTQLPTMLDLTIELDVAAIGQVLKFLFENAISNEANSSTIDVRYVADQLDGVEAITLLVSDDGVGIPLANREQAFQPFFTTKSRGTGLGLSTCKRIVDAHRGRICFGNPILGGTTVCMTLPISIPRD